MTGFTETTPHQAKPPELVDLRPRLHRDAAVGHHARFGVRRRMYCADACGRARPAWLPMPVSRWLMPPLPAVHAPAEHFLRARRRIDLPVSHCRARAERGRSPHE